MSHQGSLIANDEVIISEESADDTEPTTGAKEREADVQREAKGQRAFAPSRLSVRSRYYRF